MTRSTKYVLGRSLLCASVLAACVDKEAQGVGTDTAATSSAITGVSDTAGADTDASTGGDSSAPTSSGGGGSGDTAGGGGSDTDSLPGTSGEGATTGEQLSGCQQVDLLFVIDNAKTMGAEQEALIAAFPGFYDGITAALGVDDTHVMAVSADDGKGLSESKICIGDGCTCEPAPNCCAGVCEGGGAPDTCNGLSCAGLELSACANTYGAGRNFSNSGTFCDLAEGRRYMLGSQPGLHAAFACAASVGTYDALVDMRPMLAATEATSPALNGPGGCDEGFLRDDALLVVVFVSDKDDANENGSTGSPGGPQEWYDAIVAAKGGKAESVVMLGLVGDGNMAGGACGPDDDPSEDGLAAEPAPRLQEFVGKFQNGMIGSACAPDYGPFLGGAIATINQACEALPPGP